MCLGFFFFFKRPKLSFSAIFAVHDDTGDNWTHFWFQITFWGKPRNLTLRNKWAYYMHLWTKLVLKVAELRPLFFTFQSKQVLFIFYFHSNLTWFCQNMKILSFFLVQYIVISYLFAKFEVLWWKIQIMGGFKRISAKWTYLATPVNYSHKPKKSM